MTKPKTPAQPKTGSGDQAAAAIQDPPTTSGTESSIPATSTTVVAGTSDQSMASGAMVGLGTPPAATHPVTVIETVTARTITPAQAEAAAAAGVDPTELEPEDLDDLVASYQADLARKSSSGTRPLYVLETTGRNDAVAISLLLDACDKFGINPRADVKPMQLLAWRFYPGADEVTRVAPDAVVLVTAGGLKIKHWDDPDEPMDQDTEDRLRRVFGCFRIDPNSKQQVVDPLPEDLTLPAVHVTGISTSIEHQYQGGYLRAGGRKAAEDKQRRRDERVARQKARIGS